MTSRLSSAFILTAILFSGALLRLVLLGNDSLWYDELYTVWASKLPLDSLIEEVAASGHPPLYYLLMHGWLTLGAGELWIRLISWMVGVATIGFTFLVGKELFDHRVGLWASALVAVSPLLIWYSMDSTYYSWLIFLVLLSLFLLVRSAKRGGLWNWLGYTLATSLLLLTHFFSVVIIAAEIVVFFLLWERSKDRFVSWVVSQGFLVIILTVPTLLLTNSTGNMVNTSIPAIKTCLNSSPFAA